MIGHNLTGVFWIGEFISTAIGIEWCTLDGCSPAICYSQLVLDIPNLLAVNANINRFKALFHISF